MESTISLDVSVKHVGVKFLFPKQGEIGKGPAL